MKKDLLTILNFLGFMKFQTLTEQQSKFVFLLGLKYNLILILFIFCGSVQAQICGYPFTANASLIIPLSTDQVTIEDWRFSEGINSVFLDNILYLSVISIDNHLNYNSINNTLFLDLLKKYQ